MVQPSKFFEVEINGRVIARVPWSKPLDDPEKGQTNRIILRTILLKEIYIFKTGKYRGQNSWLIATESGSCPLHVVLEMLGKKSTHYMKDQRIERFLGYKPLIAININANIRWDPSTLKESIREEMEDSRKADPTRKGLWEFDGSNLNFRFNFSNITSVYWDLWYQQLVHGVLVKGLIDTNNLSKGYKQIRFYPFADLAQTCQELGINDS